jgi:hypothetical protein
MTTTRRICLAVVFALFCSKCLMGQTRLVRQVEIESAWEGLGPPSTAAFLIVSHRDAYWCGHKRVEAKLVNNLVSALDEDAIPEPNLQNLGPTKEWL